MLHLCVISPFSLPPPPHYSHLSLFLLSWFSFFFSHLFLFYFSPCHLFSLHMPILLLCPLFLFPPFPIFLRNSTPVLFFCTFHCDCNFYYYFCFTIAFIFAFSAVLPRTYDVHNALQLTRVIDTTDRSVVMNGYGGNFDNEVCMCMCQRECLCVCVCVFVCEKESARKGEKLNGSMFVFA